MSTIKTIAATVDGSSITGKISFAVGETVNIDLTCNDPNSPLTPLNLSGLVVIMTINCYDTGGNSIQIRRQATITNVLTGACTIPIADGDTYVSSSSICAPRAYQSDIWAEDVSGNRIDLGFGTVAITPAVGLPGATITPLPAQSPIVTTLPNQTGHAGQFLSTDGTSALWSSTGSGTGTVTNVATGTGLTGGPITTTGTIALANTAVTPGAYTNTNLTVDAQGRITAASNGSAGTGTVSSVGTGTGLTGGPITTTGTVSLANTTVTPGSYTYMSGTVDAQGRLTAASSGAAPALASTTITAGTGLSGGGDLSTNRTLAIANTAVTPGSYTNTNLTVGADGRITAASNGTGGGSGTVTSITMGSGLSSTQSPLTTSGTMSVDTTVVATTSNTLTMASKTLTAPVINGATSGGSTALDFSGNTGSFKTSTGDTTIGRHLISSGSTPVPTAGTGAGTGGTASCNGTDHTGFVTVTTGTSPATGATVVTVTFATAYAAQPKSVILTPANAAAAALTGTNQVYVDVILGLGTTVFIITSGSVALAGGGTVYRWYYNVGG